jgi:hypothetical protein
LFHAATIIGLALASVGPSLAAESVALIPATAFRGAAANGPTVTTALQESLARYRFSLVPTDRVRSAATHLRIDLGRNPIPIGQLSRLRAELGCDYLVFPRVLGVGRPLTDPSGFQATILLNVVGKSAGTFLHTMQVGQEFKAPPGAEAETAVIGRDEANKAAERLLEAFYKKTR